MLSDSLFECHHKLDTAMQHYSKKPFNYGTEIYLEVQDILNRIDQLKTKLDVDHLHNDSYRYDPTWHCKYPGSSK